MKKYRKSKPNRTKSENQRTKSKAFENLSQKETMRRGAKNQDAFFLRLGIFGGFFYGYYSNVAERTHGTYQPSHHQGYAG
jgi:hypothetical protein